MVELPTNPLLAELADDLAQSIVHRYQVDHAEAVTAILAEWSRRPDLLDVAGKVTRPEEVKRTRVYRDAAVAVKKDLYYRLRRYRPDLATVDRGVAALSRQAPRSSAGEMEAVIREVAAGHVSTAERMPHLTEFFERLVAMTGVPETIVDVGCGVLPVLVPLDSTMRGTREYWALDNDRTAIGAVREYVRVRADNRVRPVEWSVNQGWAAAHDSGLPGLSEVGFLLKVVPVVARQSSALLGVLAQTPAERLVISGSRVSMVKRQDIDRRETRLLRRFFKDYGLSELGSFRTPDEVVFLVQRA
jgi:Ribosomal RNA methyltransferase (FmrO)